ncbi:MAG: YdeI/OmpD-associated family protein [Bauldia sp.]|nr:YdeI/OmpD-associated family protein [Bauldia sp.]
MSEPIFFATPQEWRAWLEENHGRAPALWVGLRKTGSDEPGITYREALDEALCYGWIDGTRKSLDAKRWMIRFSPRKRGSIWSQVNIKRMAALEAEGRLAAPGRHTFETRDVKRQDQYSFENRDAGLAPEYEAAFRRKRKAWAWFEAMPRSYRHPAIWWVMSARQDATRERRLAQLIADSEAGRKVGPLRRPGEK